MTSFGSTVVTACSTHVDAATGHVSLNQYFRWKETISVLYFGYCFTTLPLDVFTQKKLCSRVYSTKVGIYSKTEKIVF